MPHKPHSVDSNTHPHGGELIGLPTKTLLQKFGSGGHKPGSGSAAALLGLVSCKLVQTVVTLSNGRDAYKGVKEQLTLANQNITQDIEPFLVQAFQEDSALFDRVITARRLREATQPNTPERKAASDKALEELRKATELPLEIANRSLELAEAALTVFQLGFKSARGDSGVAVSAALASANGALAIVLLNLTSFRGGAWAVEKRKAAETLQVKIDDLHRRFFKSLSDLHQEVISKEHDE